MFRVLVIDDEAIQKNGLARLLKNADGQSEVFEASNGLEGLEILRSQEMDIVFTDIKMPFVDGIEMAERIGDRRKSMKIIYISGYSHFGYAQKAIGLGAFDYILKPFSKKEIFDVLERAKVSILEERRERDEKNRLKKSMSEILPVYSEYLLNRAIKGEPLAAEEIGSFRLDRRYVCVMLTRILCPKEITESVRLGVLRMLERRLGGIGHNQSFRLENTADHVVSILSPAPGFTWEERGIAEINGAFEDYEKASGVRLIAGLSGMEDGGYSRISAAYENAKTAADASFFNENARVIPFDRLPEASAAVPAADSKTLERYVRDGDSQRIRGEVGRIFDALAVSCRSAQQIIDFARILTHDVVKENRDILDHCTDRPGLEAAVARLDGCMHLGGVKGTVAKFLEEISEAILNVHKKQNQVLMGRCLDYLNQNFAGDISLEKLAGKFHFNPSYFSDYFKRYTGRTFSQYITELRIGASKELIRNTDIPIYKVAGRVGYPDSRYFGRIFKKNVGVTPEEYRKLCVNLTEN